MFAVSSVAVSIVLSLLKYMLITDDTRFVKTIKIRPMIDGTDHQHWLFVLCETVYENFYTVLNHAALKKDTCPIWEGSTLGHNSKTVQYSKNLKT